jgi:hypothetical protein
MSFHMPITKRKINHHFQYTAWMYLVLAVVAMFGWNLIYTTTRYQSPADKRVEFYVQSSIASQESLQALADRIHQEIMPEMELVTAEPVTISSDYYGDMQLTAWFSAAQGDIYMISQDYFSRYAAGGAFMDLQPYVDAGTLDTADLDLSTGMVALAEPEPGQEGKYLYGIPTDQLTGFTGYTVDPAGMVLCVLYRNGNDEYSVKFLNYLLTNLR